ncbi:unnamed protein product [Ectocarpus sp. 12 AP-2014]
MVTGRVIKMLRRAKRPTLYQSPPNPDASSAVSGRDNITRHQHCRERGYSLRAVPSATACVHTTCDTTRREAAACQHRSITASPIHSLWSLGVSAPRTSHGSHTGDRYFVASSSINNDEFSGGLSPSRKAKLPYSQADSFSGATGGGNGRG